MQVAHEVDITDVSLLKSLEHMPCQAEVQCADTLHSSGGRDLNKFDNALGARVNDALLNYETGETVVVPPRCRQASLQLSAILHLIACPYDKLTSMSMGGDT